MAINKNHEFEELDGVKCGVVERNVLPERVQFLKSLLEFNKFTVIAVPTPGPKAAALPATKPVAEEETQPHAPPPIPVVELPKTFTVGVTDYTFNPVNAIFGRLLKAPDGHFVTLGYWQQKQNVSHDEVPYFGEKAG